MANIQGTELWIDKGNLGKVTPTPLNLSEDDIAPGQAVLEVSNFGFSANNITYGLLGHKMGYWGFFPADDAHGILPVWGFATVLASKADGLEVGTRVYGYLPLATHILVQPDKLTPLGFVDAHPKRKSISPVYDYYQFCASDPGYNSEHEVWQQNLRPLFMTSFVLDDFVRETLPQTCSHIFVTSASSKTALGAAFLLKKHLAEEGKDAKVVGLTSAGNLAFTEQSGCYDQVAVYGDDDALPTEAINPIALDFAGNKQVLLDLQHRYTDFTAWFIGATDVEAQMQKPSGELKGEIFFAPAQVKKRHKDWGVDAFNQRYAAAWSAFAKAMLPVMGSADHQGVDAIIALYLNALQGKLATQTLNNVVF